MDFVFGCHIAYFTTSDGTKEIDLHNHERLRNQQREALRQAEHFFQTLLARVFGESD